MAIRNEDWAKITKALEDGINDAVKSLRPSGFRKVARWLREWTVLGPAIAAFIALIAIAFGAVYVAIGEVKQNAEFRGRSDSRLGQLEKDVLSIRLLLVAPNPRNAASQAQAKEILNTARTTSVHLSKDVIERTGKSFLEAATDDPKAWDVALDFVSYRSALNGPPPTGSQPPVPITANQALNFAFTGPTGNSSEMNLATVGPPVPTNQSARAEPIGNPSNPKAEIGPAFLLGREGAVVLDGSYLRHVVFTNVKIIYRGGPVILEDVYFVNCRFVMPNEENSRRLGSHVLASSQVTFNAG